MTPKPLEQQVAELAALVAEHERVISALRSALGIAGSTPADVAPDRDLDSEYGDEKIRMNPREWTGAPRKGWPMSKCEPDFLDLYAETMIYFAGKNAADAKKAGYDRRAAARARGWAKRLREGWQPKSGVAPARDGWGRPVSPKSTSDDRYAPPAPRTETAFDGFDQAGDDEIPF